MRRQDDGTWVLEVEGAEEEAMVAQGHPSYAEALPRYLALLDPVFERAREASEFEFVWSLLAIRGLQDAGWDPYESTVQAIGAVRLLHAQSDNSIAQMHLGLWVYGHILEASEPYEMLANLVRVARGERFKISNFRRALPPGKKMDEIAEFSRRAELEAVVEPYREAWDCDLRNAVFHSDYALHRGEVRTLRPIRSYAHDEALQLINRALAVHDAVLMLRNAHVQSYDEPVEVPTHPDFEGAPGETGVVIVREGYGATGLKDTWTAEELAAGWISWRMGRFTQEETRMLDEDPTLAVLPATQV